jgi:hypothetical protein
LHEHPEFKLAYRSGDVYLFRQEQPPAPFDPQEAAADFRPAAGK